MADPFVAAVRAAPDDDLPRLIFADYLEERGDPRGPFIRAQIALARMPADDPRREEHVAVEAESLAAHEAEWLGDLADTLYRWWFHRGFLEVSLDIKRYLDEPNEWLDLSTVGGVLLYARRRCRRNCSTTWRLPIVRCGYGRCTWASSGCATPA